MINWSVNWEVLLGTRGVVEENYTLRLKKKGLYYKKEYSFRPNSPFDVSFHFYFPY